MSEPREFWIRKGTNGFSYETFGDNPGETIRSLSNGDQFYDAVVSIDGGLHVIEKSAYDAILVENKKLRSQLAGVDEIVSMENEIDAYKKAKAENDERFQLEIEELKLDLQECRRNNSLEIARACHADEYIKELKAQLAKYAKGDGIA